MPTLLVRSGRNPTEAFVSVGILFLLTYTAITRSAPSQVVTSGLPQAPAQWSWGTLCAIGAALTLAGLWLEWRRDDPILGLTIEHAGQFAQGVGIGCYVLLLWSESSFSASGIPIVMGSALSLGALGRTVQIWRGLRRIRRGGTS